jgi:hypothetical protein
MPLYAPFQPLNTVVVPQRRLRLLGLLFAGGGVSSSPLESPSLELLLPPDLVSSPDEQTLIGSHSAS